MSKQSHGLPPVADHQRIHTAVEPRLRGVAPALNTPVENANQTINKAIVTMNRAGSNPRNPLAKGLGMRFQFRTGSVDRLRAVYIFQDRRVLGANLISSVGSAAPGVFTLDHVLGQGVSVAGPSNGAAKRNFIRWESAFGTSEREFYVKDKEQDVILINGKKALDANLNPVTLILTITQPSLPFIGNVIDFFPSWNDEFGVLHRDGNPNIDPGLLKAYGGTAVVSFFDTTVPIAPTRFSKVLDEPFGPGLATLNSTQVISGLVGNITKVTIGFHILSFNTNVLELRLIGPDSTTIDIAISRGGIKDYGTACTDDTTKTIADDSATLTFITGSNPFTGPHKPDVALSGLNGKSGGAINGTWTLQVKDVFAGSPGGTLKCWHIEIDTDGTAAGTEGVGTKVNPVTQQPIENLHEIEVQNTTGLKDITVRFRSKAGSVNFIDCPILFNVQDPPAGSGVAACIVPGIESCIDLFLKLGTPLPTGLPSVESTPGVQVVAGTPGVPLDRELLYVTVRGAIAGGNAQLRVQKWRWITSAEDVAGGTLDQVGGDLDFLPLKDTSSSPLLGAAYQAPQRMTIAFNVTGDRAAGIAFYSVEVLDVTVPSTPVVIAGPASRSVCFFQIGGTGGGSACAY